MQSLHIPEYQTYITVKSYIKHYPSFSKLYIYDTPITQQQKGFEETSPKNKKKKTSKTPPESEQKLQQYNSSRRTKTRLTDITLCNNFDLFVTFTFKNDRQNITKLKKQMSKWLSNQKTLHGNFSYVIVPEFHKDRKSIHFHALFKNYRGKLTPTHIKQNGRTIYNISSYRLGFSTAVKIDNVAKVSSYIRKYISKDMPKFEGKKRYWCSTQLKRPIIETNPYVDIFSFDKQVKLDNLTIYKSKHKLPILSKPKEYTWPQILTTSLVLSTSRLQPQKSLASPINTSQ